MTLLQAIGYFLREAAVNLARGWKVSLLAVFTIAVSLFLGGVFLLVSSNLRERVDEWRADSRLVVYLESEARGAAIERVEDLVEAAPSLLSFDLVQPEVAADRFQQAFPSLADLLEGWGEQPLPASFEVQVDWGNAADTDLAAWLGALKNDPAVEMIDDDRDWLAQLDALVLLLEAMAVVLGTVLLATAIFTISSVIRLTAYLYHDEIAVMRLVGATEFFIRGPFYAEGLLQGLAGGGVSMTMLLLGHRLLLAEGPLAVSSLLAQDFLSPTQVAILISLGGLAGLVGAITSLRRESLGQTAETRADWDESN